MSKDGVNRDGVRFVKFPPNRSIGVIQVRDWGISGGWQWFHEAQGTIAVPIGKEVRLKINPEAVSDLTPLLNLELDDIQWIDLSKTAIADGQLKNLEKLSLLRRLDLRNTPIGDAALAHVSKLSSIKELRLNGTRITDAGLAHLAPMPRLENLWLYDTAISDAGMKSLAQISSLEVLQLPKTISQEAITSLRNALPHCYINAQR